MTSLSRDELGKAVAKKLDISLIQTQAVVQAILDEVQTALINDRKVEFRGFGSLKPVWRKERKGRLLFGARPTTDALPAHDQTANALVCQTIPAHRAVKFKVGSQLAKLLNPEHQPVAPETP